MPLGAFRLNSLARLQAAAGLLPAESQTDLTDPDVTFLEFGDGATDTWSGYVYNDANLSLTNSQDFTLSMWVRPTLTGGAGYPENFWDGWVILDIVDDGTKACLRFGIYDNGGMFYYAHRGSGFTNLTGFQPSGTFTADTWHHIAIAVDGSASDMQVYIDGTDVGYTGTESLFGTNYAWSSVDLVSVACQYNGWGGGLNDRMAQLWWDNSFVNLDTNISKFYDSGFVYMGPNGMASGLVRPQIFLEGDASSFNVNRGTNTTYDPDSDNADPNEATAGPPWTNFNGSGDTVYWDSTPNETKSRTRKTITATNVSASQVGGDYKFGISAMDHVGSILADSWLKVSASSDFAWGTGDYTIEAWFKADNQSRTRYLWDTRNSSTNGSYLYIDSSNNLNLVTGATTTTGTATISTGTFYHIATVRNGGTTKVYVDGVEDISVSDSTNHTNSSGAVYIGADYLETTQETFGGFIDEFRISSVARYTGDFTTMSRRFNNKANTLFLLHGDMVNGSTTFIDDNVTG